MGRGRGEGGKREGGGRERERERKRERETKKETDTETETLPVDFPTKAVFILYHCLCIVLFHDSFLISHSLLNLLTMLFIVPPHKVYMHFHQKCSIHQKQCTSQYFWHLYIIWRDSECKKKEKVTMLLTSVKYFSNLLFSIAGYAIHLFISPQRVHVIIN